jgi:hypothetical protein
VLLAHNIGQKINSLPTYLKNIDDPLVDAVIHSHKLLTIDQTLGYTRVFNLRIDPVETILSCFICDHSKQYHKFATKKIDIIDPFVIDIDSVWFGCESFITWHNYYSKTLSQADCVVVYETMIAGLINPVYDRIYPDKKQLIINYEEVVEKIKEFQPELEMSSKPFIDHQNVLDIYQLTT